MSNLKLVLAPMAGLCLLASPLVLLGQSDDRDEEEQGSSNAIEEIVVTAQRREQNVQDVPISIDITTGKALIESGITDLSLLADTSPSLTVTGQSAWTGTASVFIRGQGGGAFNRDPGVGIYINEAYVAAATSILSQFTDIERVETLKGPQGTLWGRVTLGGAMSITTKKPTEDFQADVRVEYSSFDTKKLALAISGPITETVKARLSYNRAKGDTYMDDLVQGRLDATDLEAVRSSLEWDPTDNFSVDLTLSYTTDDSRSPLMMRNILIPGSPADLASNVVDLPQSGDFHTTASDFATQSEYRESFGILSMAYDLNDEMTIKSITSTFKTESERLSDFDGTAANLASFPMFNDDETLSQELQFFYTGDRLNAVVGLYYYKEDRFLEGGFNGNVDLQVLASCTGTSSSNAARFFRALGVSPEFFDTCVSPYPVYMQRNDATLTEAIGEFFSTFPFGSSSTDFATLPDYYANTVAAALGRPVTALDFADGGVLETMGLDIWGTQAFNIFTNINETESSSAYFNLEYALSNEWSVTAGARYTEDDKYVEQNGFTLTIVGFDNYGPFTNIVTYREVTPRVGIEWRPQLGILAYANYSKGYTAGEQNPALDVAGPAQTVDAWELGAKSLLADDTIQLNVSAFYYDYSDFTIIAQVSEQVAGQSRVPVIYDSVVTTGIEADVIWLATDNLTIDLAVMSLSSDIEEVGSDSLPAGVTLLSPVFGTPFDPEDLSIVRTPEQSAKLSATYKMDLGEAGGLHITGSAVYTNEYDLDVYKDFESKARTLTNLSMLYFPKRGGWSVNLFARNLFDKEYIVSRSTDDSFGVTLRPGLPRVVGIQFNKTFN